MNAKKAAKKLGVSAMTVKYRLASPLWTNWVYLTDAQIEKAYSFAFRAKKLTIESRLKTSKPFFGGDKLYLSRYHCSEKTGLSPSGIQRRLRSSNFPGWRFAIPEEIQNAVKNGLFLSSKNARVS